MFKAARLRLTITYSLIFFAIFWSFSAGLYIWMGKSLDEGYITQVVDIQEGYQDPVDSRESNDPVNPEDLVTTAGEVALANLLKILLETNMIMIFLVPILSWLLTGRTLRPIQQSYEQQHRFVSDASHELKTPLTIIQSELDLALKKKRTNSQYKEAIENTNDEVGRLRELTESLLTLTRMNRNQRLRMEEVDLTDVVQETVSYLKKLARKNKVKLRYTPPAGSIKVKGSAVSLRQMLTNIIDNAIKFSSENSVVVISLRDSKDKIYINIIDTGLGMSAKQVKHAFDRFYRADRSRTNKGFGLGLAISKVIASQHNGSIDITSVPGKGTTVTITFAL